MNLSQNYSNTTLVSINPSKAGALLEVKDNSNTTLVSINPNNTQKILDKL